MTVSEIYKLEQEIESLKQELQTLYLEMALLKEQLKSLKEISINWDNCAIDDKGYTRELLDEIKKSFIEENK